MSIIYNVYISSLRQPPYRLACFLRHHKDIIRVNFWCLNDANSWRNDFPIQGRSDYATLYDRQNQPKGMIQEIINLVKPQQTTKKNKRK